MARHQDRGTITAGAPQGSILGLLLFIIYTNDLTDRLKCDVKLFGDDTSIFTVVHEPRTAAENLNHDINLINQWTFKWRMPFHPDPSKQAVEVTFSKKRCPGTHPSIVFNNAPVRSVHEHKHLGVKFIISKCRQGIGMLKFLAKYLPRHTLNDMFKHYVRPPLD